MQTTRDIGTRLELFVDDWLIEKMDGVTLRMHHPVRREVALQFNRPWEGPSSSFPRVMKDGDRYRMWYRAADKSVAGSERTGYAESENGIRWRRPALGIVDFNGSTENNIVLDGTKGRNLCVFRDDNPQTPDAERYKAIAKLPRFVDGKRDAIRGFTSSDGLRWRIVKRDPVLIAPDDAWPMFDSFNVAFWDAVQGQYVSYLRGWIPAEDEGRDGRVRSIRRSVSEDFLSWSEPEFIDTGGAPVEHLYTNACTPYFRAPHIYLMFPRRFVPERKFYPEWPNTGISEGVFMSSRDGIHWDRRFMEAFLRPGPDPDNWTDRNTTAGVGVVPTGPAELSIYYVEHFRHPSDRLRRTTIRTDGFVSVNAPYGGGEFVTRPLTFAGEELVINYSTSVAGGLRVEIQDVEGRPLDGYQLSESAEIFGDEIERVVAWKSGPDVSALSRRPVRLRFVMKEADLYSIQFREARGTGPTRE